MTKKVQKKLIIMNWKMSPSTLREAKGLISILKTKHLIPNTEIVVCPPFEYLSDVAGLINKTKIKLGGQNVFYKDRGAYTGEISPKMLKNLGVKYVIIGHSERRAMGETDGIINKKVIAALKDGLKVILCVGEQARGKAQGAKREAEKTIKEQLQKDLKGIGNWKLEIGNLAIAYEPIWAISSNKNAEQDTPKDAAEMSKFIKKYLKSYFLNLKSAPVLYGGSVNSKNVLDFIKQKEINGALVGHASVDKKELTKILNKLE